MLTVDFITLAQNITPTLGSVAVFHRAEQHEIEIGHEIGLFYIRVILNSVSSKYIFYHRKKKYDEHKIGMWKTWNVCLITILFFKNNKHVFFNRGSKCVQYFRDFRKYIWKKIRMKQNFIKPLCAWNMKYDTWPSFLFLFLHLKKTISKYGSWIWGALFLFFLRWGKSEVHVVLYRKKEKPTDEQSKERMKLRSLDNGTTQGDIEAA